MINSKMRIKSPMLPLVVSVFLLFYPFPAASGTDSKAVVLTCGASNTGKDADGREWSPDAEYFTSSISASSAASSQDPSLPSEVPYMTARTFMSDATYSLPAIADQRYWIRLHFYPATYGSLNPNDAYLDVIADGVQLLKNFSVTQTSKALTQAYIVKEYSLAPPASASLINITFTPSMNGSYAFVNGIELIPFPNLFRSFGKMIGVPDEKIDVNTSSFETVHRLNVGGRYIAPAIDPASRTWYDDTPYLYGENVGVTTNSSGRIDYDGMPESIAPVDVYSTARSMGYDYNLNLMYNLTWQFQVDVNFNYLLRLHFCDYQARGVNQIVFDIFVNGELAEAGVDIIGWTNKSSVPVYKDYVIFVKENSRNDEHITLALHPATDADEQPQFYDALLNGLEIFKMDDPMRNLAGPNPRPSNMLLRAEAKEAARAGQAMARFSAAEDGIHVMGGAAGGAAFGAMAVICMTAYIKKRKVQGVDGSTAAGSLPISGLSQSDGSKSSHSTSTSHLSLVAQGFCRQFTLAEIKQATKNFSESNVVGLGGFGKVYKGVIDKTTEVAIKRSNPQSEQGVLEFQTEVEMLSKLRHKHLVSLVGYCEEDHEMCLVYDYMEKGTLRDHIYKSNNPPLPWKQRLHICIGAARGLHYLHTGSRYTIIHRDVKTTNILLDESWVAKVSDFGLSKTGPTMDKGHVSTVVKGSFGYLDPEYFRRQHLTEKSDVYSFGVVLFEVLCARPALNPNLPKEQISLADWAKRCLKNGTLEDTIDPYIKDKIDPECLKKFAETAGKCLSKFGTDRPTMGDVLWNLEFALQQQEASESEGSSRRTRERTDSFAEISLADNHDMNHGRELEDNDGSAEIFSQIGNPTGR